MSQIKKYDALLIVSFGGPEGMGDVLPFLDNVLRGKNVPESRKKEVAHHYEMFGGVSPINSHNRELKKLLEEKLDIPVFWGNRNWKPYLRDALLEMKNAGVKNALAFVTSAYGSYSGCRQYLENMEQARSEMGAGAPVITKLRFFYDHPKFIEAIVHKINKSLHTLSEDRKENLHVAFTAHSIPESMAKNSPYVSQLTQTCEKVAKNLQLENWNLVYQSRSGPPTIPWLGPDILDHIGQLSERKGVKNLLISPIGFVSDHMEVLYDLDVEAKKLCDELGIFMIRAETPGNDPRMIQMILELVEEQQQESAQPFICKPDCCKR